MITADELLKASQPLRPKTAEESRQALEALGIDEDMQRLCNTCKQWKTVDEFVLSRIVKGVQQYTPDCKPCRRVRQAHLHMARTQYLEAFRTRETKLCTVCKVEKHIEAFPRDGLYADGTVRRDGRCLVCKRRQHNLRYGGNT